MPAQNFTVPVDANVLPAGVRPVRVGRTNSSDPNEKYLGNDGALHSSSANRDGRIRLIVAEVRDPKYQPGDMPFLVKYVPTRAPYCRILEVLGEVDGQFQYRVDTFYPGDKVKKVRLLESDLCCDPDGDCDC